MTDETPPPRGENQPGMKQPPTPLPPAWERAIANSIATFLADHGWQTHREIYAYHPTGAPRGHSYSSVAPAPTFLPNIEILEFEVYAWGVVEPEHYPNVNIPPLVWLLAQLDLAKLIHDTDPALATAAEGWLVRARRPQADPHLFKPKTNRHGNLTPNLTRVDAAIAQEALAFTLAARAAKVSVIREEKYSEYLETKADPMNPAALAAIAARSGVSLANEMC